MLGRISFAETHGDIQRALAHNNKETNRIGNQLTTQTRVQELREDPMAASHGSRYASMLVRKEMLTQQNRETYDQLQFAEGYINQMVEILQKGRELAVRVANGTFTKEDRSYTAEEINQFLEELHTVANAQDSDGRYIFGGARTNIPPFRDLRTVSDRMHKDVITDVEYVGSNKPNLIEISDNDLVPRSIPGSDLLWSERTSIVSKNDNLNYVVPQDSEIVLNNVVIQLSQGDGVQAIIRKINESASSINATIDGFTGNIRLSSTVGSQAWVSDKTGAVMQELGFINGNNSPPYNISGDATVFDENLFKTMIRLRDAMYEDDYKDIGGRALASVDTGLQSVLESLGKVGAISERLDIVHQRLDQKDIPNITKQLDSQISIDIADTIVKWQQMLQAQQAAYQVSNSLMGTSLLQFLR